MKFVVILILLLGSQSAFSEAPPKLKTEMEHEAEERARRASIEATQKDLRERRMRLKDEIAALKDPSDRKRAEENLARLESVLVEANLAAEICDYRTCRNEYCEGKYDCKNFTKDFCEERKKKTKETFCVGFAFLCKTAVKQIGHTVAMIKKDDKHCLIEPKKSAVLGCWKSEKTGSEILYDHADKIEKILTTYWDFFGKECDTAKGDRALFPYDAEILKFSEKIQCCLCKHPSGVTTVVANLDEHAQLYCQGICEDRKETLEKRVPCTAAALLEAKGKK